MLLTCYGLSVCLKLLRNFLTFTKSTKEKDVIKFCVTSVITDNYYGPSKHLEVIIKRNELWSFVEEPYGNEVESPDTRVNDEEETTDPEVNKENKGHQAIHIQ